VARKKDIQTRELFGPLPVGMLGYEQRLWEEGFCAIAGVDEVGRGPLAGPVVASAVILPRSFDIEGIDDSKKLTARRREKQYDRILSEAAYWAIGQADVLEIETINILQASKLAMCRALEKLGVLPDYVLVDGNQRLDISYRQQTLIGGDGRSASIAAASILAKVTRDKIMAGLHQKWPQYGFASHKGYATRAHREAIQTHGPCPVHRKTFAKVKEFVKP
jgi:ribonuclease HII